MWTGSPVASDDCVVNVDALTYAGNLENLRDLESDPGTSSSAPTSATGRRDAATYPRHAIEPSSTSPPRATSTAASSRAAPFLETNVVGTHRLLEAARAAGRRRSCRFRPTKFTAAWDRPALRRDDALRPHSPYSASKAAADAFVLAYITPSA